MPPSQATATTDTICGYALIDVRRSLRDAIDRREPRAARRWTAELVATPAAVGSLWAAYWLAWAAAQGAGSASPTLPILLRQKWSDITAIAHAHMDDGTSWSGFRNDPAVRATAAEMTVRLLAQPRQTPVVWPSREIILYDVSLMRDSPPPPATDGRVVLRVWERGDDSMELRMMAGRFLAALEAGDIRTALSAVAWTLLPPAQQALTQPFRVADRGPSTLPLKARTSAIWFWLDLGKALLTERGSDIHRGWYTMHQAISAAFREHFKRWTAAERMRMLLAWILQIRATYVAEPPGLWTAEAFQQTLSEIDLPYKEVAAELANPQDQVIQHGRAPDSETESKKAKQARIAARMAESEAAVMAAMGLTEED
jgi:hypothetical protein